MRWEKGGNFVAHRFTPDSRHLVVGKSDGSLCVYDVATGKDVAVVRCSGTVTNVIAVSPDGRHVATGGGAYWSNEENKMIHDGDFALRIWRLPEAIAPPTPDTDAEAPQQSPAEIEEVGRFQGHKNWVYEVAFSADGKYAISVSNDRTVRVWNVESGESVHLFKTEKAATALDVSPDGKTIAVGYGPHDADKQSTSRIAAYALESGEAIGSLEAHRSEIRAIQFSPDGRFLVSASHDGTSRLWDVETWKEVRRFDDGDRDIFDAQFALDGRRVVTLEGFGGVGVWDVETGKKLCRLGPMVRGSELSSFAVEPDGKTALLCYARGLFERFDVKSGESTGRFRSETEFYPHDAVVTPDGRHVLVGGGDCTLRLLDVVTGRQLARVTRENNVFTRLAISPDGRFALSAGGRAWDAAKRVDSLTGDYEIRLWRLPEGAPPRTRDDGGTP